MFLQHPGDFAVAEMNLGSRSYGFAAWDVFDTDIVKTLYVMQSIMQTRNESFAFERT